MKPLPLAMQTANAIIKTRLVRLIDVSALHENCWPHRAPSAIYQMILRAQRNADQGRGLGLVAVDDAGEAVAYAQLTLWPRCGELSDLIVGINYRGRGIGTALIQHLVKAAREMHVDCLEIGAALSNPRAVELYRRLGFKDSHEVMLNLGRGQEAVLYLRLDF